MAAGSKLKSLRNRCNITVRQVEQASGRIADAKGDKRFRISNGWLVQLENGISEPSICKLFSLCATYGATFNELARLYNVDIDEIEKYILVANPQLTQLSPVDHDGSDLATPDFRGATCTDLMPRLVSSSSEAAPARTVSFGYIGLTDYTMYPLIRPGAIVEIDTSQNKLHSNSWDNEFERPIFFVELRGGYACGWCELQNNHLLIIPHPSSRATVRSFAYPREAEIVGRVVGYKTRCVDIDTQTLAATQAVTRKKASK